MGACLVIYLNLWGLSILAQSSSTSTHQVVQEQLISPPMLQLSFIFNSCYTTLRMRNMASYWDRPSFIKRMISSSQMLTRSSAQLQTLLVQRQKMTTFLRYFWGLRYPQRVFMTWKRQSFLGAGILVRLGTSSYSWIVSSFFSSYQQPRSPIHSTYFQTDLRTMPQRVSMFISFPSLDSLIQQIYRYFQTNSVQASEKSLISSSSMALLMPLLSRYFLPSSSSLNSSSETTFLAGFLPSDLPLLRMFLRLMFSLKMQRKCLKGTEMRLTLSNICSRALAHSRQNFTRSLVQAFDSADIRSRKTVSGISRLEFCILAILMTSVFFDSDLFLVSAMLVLVMKRGRKSESASGYSSRLMLTDICFSLRYQSLRMLELMTLRWYLICSSSFCLAMSCCQRSSCWGSSGCFFSIFSVSTSQKQRWQERREGMAWMFISKARWVIYCWRSCVSNLHFLSTIQQNCSLLMGQTSSKQPRKCALNLALICLPQLQFDFSPKDSSSWSSTDSRLLILQGLLRGWVLEELRLVYWILRRELVRTTSMVWSNMAQMSSIYFRLRSLICCLVRRTRSALISPSFIGPINIILLLRIRQHHFN